jgi:hypothetical protein
MKLVWDANDSEKREDRMPWIRKFYVLASELSIQDGSQTMGTPGSGLGLGLLYFGPIGARVMLIRYRGLNGVYSTPRQA